LENWKPSAGVRLSDERQDYLREKDEAEVSKGGTESLNGVVFKNAMVSRMRRNCRGVDHLLDNKEKG